VTEAEAVAKRKLDSVVESLWKAVRFLMFLGIINLAITVVLVVNVQTRNDNLEEIERVQGKIDTSVEEIRTVAEDLSEVTPDEQSRNSAIAAAVATIPVIKAILCEEFQSTQCVAQPIGGG
jgi:hypothetical protein